MSDPSLPTPPPTDTEAEGRELVLRLFLRHQAMLQGFLYAMCEDWEVVEDAAQETALFICRRWTDYQPGSNFPAWLRAIGRLRCHEAIRRRPAARAPVESLADELTEADWTAVDGRAGERQAALARCLGELPERDRTVLTLRYQQEVSCEAIAQRLGSTVEALYMSLSRLRRRLRLCIEKRLIGSS